MPALEAAKGVEAQGGDLFIRYHFALLRALFEENLDISDPQVLLSLASSVGADCDRLSRELEVGCHRNVVWAEHDQAVKQFRIHSVPTVVFAGKRLVVGAVPREVYQRAIEDLLVEEQRECLS